jgi:hypothetical protein
MSADKVSLREQRPASLRVRRSSDNLSGEREITRQVRETSVG